MTKQDTIQETIAKLFARDDYDLPNERWGLEDLLRLKRAQADKLLGQIRISAERLSGPMPDHMTLRTIGALASMGEDYREILDIIRQAETKLRVVEEIERLYAGRR